MQNKKRSSYKRRIWEICVFALLGAIMFCAKFAMSGLPNIHMGGMLVMVYTLTFRKKALIPIYVYVTLEGLVYGFFSSWWVAYLYVWIILWGATMLIPKNLSKKALSIIYPVVCALFGLSFGILCAPPELIYRGYNLQMTLVYLINDMPFNIIHCIGNFVFGLFVLPLSELLKKLYKQSL